MLILWSTNNTCVDTTYGIANLFCSFNDTYHDVAYFTHTFNNVSHELNDIFGDFFGIGYPRIPWTDSPSVGRQNKGSS
jgi:hypothetical protein